MKITIRNSLLGKVKLFFLSLISIKILIAPAFSAGINNSIFNTVFNQSKFTPLYSSSNSLITLSDSGNYFILLKNNRSCQDCFTEINRYIHFIKDSLNARFLVVALIDSNTLERKRNYISDKNLLPDFDEYYFQYNNSALSELFKNAEIDFTPKIVIISNGIIFQIPYQNIFDYPSLNISESTQLKIFNLLK